MGSLIKRVYQIHSIIIYISRIAYNLEMAEKLAIFSRLCFYTLLTLTLTAARRIGDRCDKACIQVYAPVCGSDGVTYSNGCFLGLAQCRDSSITQVSDGECPEPNPCGESEPLADAICGGIGALSCPDPSTHECVLPDPPFPDASGVCCPIADPCSTVCIQVYNPVCGSDDVTYSNDCFLGIAQCQDQSITKVSDGECPEPNPCEEGEPLADTTCGGILIAPCPDPSTHECVLPDPSIPESAGVCCPIADPCDVPCIEIFAPVCGSDGVTYDNDCFLGIAQCRDSSITKVSDGECPIPTCPFSDDVQVSIGDACSELADGRSSCPTEVCYASAGNGDERFCCNPCDKGEPLAGTVCGTIAGLPCSDPNQYECVLLKTFSDSEGACCPIAT